jgi:phage N-6-adenine-methyltransferase
MASDLITQSENDLELTVMARSMITKVENELEQLNDPIKARDLKSKTAAMADYARKTIRDRRLKIEAANDLIFSTIRINQWLGEWLEENHSNNRVIRSHDATYLSDLGINKNESSRLKSQALVPVGDLKQYYETVKAEGEQLTIGSIVEWGRKIKGGDMLTADTIRINARANNIWYTPPCYIESARLVLGQIDLDPASSPEANETILAETFFTEETDGLLQDWFGKVWLNPPYGRIAAEFTLKLVTEYESGHIDEAILLINSNTTDTNWFQPLWAYTLCFTDHRINFHSPQNTEAKGSTHGSLFVYFGENTSRFCKEFKQYGAVVRCING